MSTDATQATTTPIDPIDALQQELDAQKSAGQQVVAGKKGDPKIRALIESKIQTVEDGVRRLAEIETTQRELGVKIESSETAIEAATNRGISPETIAGARQAVVQLKQKYEALGTEHHSRTAGIYDNMRDLKVFGWTTKNGSAEVQKWAAGRMDKTEMALGSVRKDAEELKQAMAKVGLELDLSRTEEMLGEAQEALDQLNNKSSSNAVFRVGNFLSQANGSLKAIVALETRIQRQEAAGQQIPQEVKDMLEAAKVAFSARRFQPKDGYVNSDNPTVREAITAAFTRLPQEQDSRLTAAAANYYRNQPQEGQGGYRGGGHRNDRQGRRQQGGGYRGGGQRRFSNNDNRGDD